MNATAVPTLGEGTSARFLSRRQGILLAAALAGGALGALFASEIVQAATGVWSAFVVPAFFELLLSGVPFCA